MTNNSPFLLCLFYFGRVSKNISRDIETIKAIVGFEKLQAMRNASPTGGALGQVSEMENRLLQSTLGSMEIDQETNQLIANLRQVRGHLSNVNTAARTDLGQTEAPTDLIRITTPSSITNVYNSIQNSLADNQTESQIIEHFKSQGVDVTPFFN